MADNKIPQGKPIAIFSWKLLWFCFTLLLLSGCGSGGSAIDPGKAPATGASTAATGDWYRPPLNVSWQWQLKGQVNTGYPVEIYDIDLVDATAPVIDSIQASGAKVTCYFSAGSYEKWRPDQAEFAAGDLGKTLKGWDDEKWLDIRSAGVKTIMQKRLDLAEQKGCDAVEPDNVDGYTNDSGFDLTADDQLAFNRFIATEAHKRGLAVGLKNDLDQVDQLADYFDFSVSEQCHEFEECDQLAPFIASGKPVLNAEYEEKLVADAKVRQSLCDAAGREKFSTLVLPLELDDSFRFSCQ